jgi:peptidylprolyl isomerase
MQKSKIFILASLSMLLLTACTTDGGVDPMVNQNSSSSGSFPEVGGNKDSKPTISAPVGNPPSTLQSKDIFEGSGKEAVATSVGVQEL